MVESNKEYKLSFHGAAGTVTGSKHLLTLPSGKNILLDCGMFQGKGTDTGKLNRHFGFNPAEVDAVILSHAHIDHSGLLPRLVKEGFSGPIFSTGATFDLCKIMLRDSARIQSIESEYINKKREEEGRSDLVKPLYDEEDVEACLDLFVPVPFDDEVEIFKNCSFRFYDNGHILGSAAIQVQFAGSSSVPVKLFYTGDIGRYHSPLLNDPSPFEQADYIICESTYGDRVHEQLDDSAMDLYRTIQEVCIENRGRLIIPAFSLGRTQELVYSLNKLDLKGILPEVKFFVDSPLSVDATEIVRHHAGILNQEVKETLKKDDDPFGFDQLTYISERKDSIALNDLKEPCVIISASGMAEAGRVKHHIRHAISDPRNMILLVGYAEPESLGGQLRAGNSEVRIYGRMHEVKCKVKVIESYSAHGDKEEMKKYLSCQNPSKVKQLFLVHGEKDSRDHFASELKVLGFENISLPLMHQQFSLNC